MNPMNSDSLGRPLRDLRISVTDRCNFRCGYCMPKDRYGRDFAFLPQPEILSFEELHRLTRIFVGLGVTKIRITGGEPLVRRGLETLVAALTSVEGIRDLSLTTNGSLLAARAAALAEAGLHRITVSLDSLDDEVFRRMNDVDIPVERVLAGIAAAEAAGLSPIKINCVVRRAVNDHTIVELARHFHGTPHIIRFIEYMDVGGTIGWKLDEVVPSREIVERIHAEMPLEPVAPSYRGEVASRYRYLDGGGEIGLVSSVTRPFCSDCTRARLTADGSLYTCLFGSTGHDLKALVRSDASDEAIAHQIASIWTRRGDRYSELRTEETATLPRVEMSRVGG
jgi:GTP 3',8-cyclase